MPETSSLEQTESLRAEFKRLSCAAGELARRLTPALWARRPAEDRWSVAECIEHLTLITELMMPRLEGILRRIPPAGNGPFQIGRLDRLFLWYLEPPYRAGLAARPPFQPRVEEAPEQVLPRFVESQARIELFLQAAAGLALDRAYIESPVSSRMKYSAWAALLILAAHQRRHLWQAEKIAAQLAPNPRP